MVRQLLMIYPSPDTQARRRISFRLTAPDLDKAKEEKDFGVVD
jgi:hypothetical protein